MVCSPVDLEAAEAAFFSAGAGDEGGGGDVAGAAVGVRVGGGGDGVVVAGVGDVGSHAAAAAAAATSAGDDGGGSPMLRRSARAHSLNKLLAFLCIVCRLCTVDFCCIKMNFLLFFLTMNTATACSATTGKAAYASSSLLQLAIAWLQTFVE